MTRSEVAGLGSLLSAARGRNEDKEASSYLANVKKYKGNEGGDVKIRLW